MAKVFLVPVTWRTSGTYTVQAETIQEAVDKVLDAEPPYEGLPKETEYVENSMQIDNDRLKEINALD